MINNKLKKDIKKYSIENSSIEVCGVILKKGGRENFLKCKNIHPNPSLAFTFSPKYLVMDDLSYIFHSHPKCSSDPSLMDRKYCNELKIPFLIYSLPDDDFSLCYPE